MGMSQSSAVNVVPLLARLVLGMTFITVGWWKFSDQQFTDQNGDVTKLRELGLASATNAGTSLHLASWTAQDPAGGGSGVDPGQDESGGDATQDPPPGEEGGAQDEGAEAAPPDDSNADAGADDGATEAPATLPGGTVTKKALYNIAIMLHGTALADYAGYLAWAAAVTELVGGGLILIGLFARLWGLALSCVMGVAFYLTSLPALTGVNFNLFNLDFQVFGAMTSQLALLVLAFGVFLVGPGALSVDRMLFKDKDEADADVDLT